MTIIVLIPNLDRGSTRDSTSFDVSPDSDLFSFGSCLGCGLFNILLVIDSTSRMLSLCLISFISFFICNNSCWILCRVISGLSGCLNLFKHLSYQRA